METVFYSSGAYIASLALRLYAQNRAVEKINFEAAVMMMPDFPRGKRIGNGRNIFPKYSPTKDEIKKHRAELTREAERKVENSRKFLQMYAPFFIGLMSLLVSAGAFSNGYQNAGDTALVFGLLNEFETGFNIWKFRETGQI